MKLGSTRKWAIGFFDISATGAFSEVMDMKLESADSKEPVYKEKVELDEKTVGANGDLVANYKYLGIDCAKPEKCAGWSIGGNYQVTSTKKGNEAKITLNADIVSSKPFSSGQNYGIAFNFPFEENGKE